MIIRTFFVMLVLKFLQMLFEIYLEAHFVKLTLFGKVLSDVKLS
jgi:hypothetical protein